MSKNGWYDTFLCTLHTDIQDPKKANDEFEAAQGLWKEDRPKWLDQFAFQVERSTTGLLHIQLAVQTNKRIRVKALRRWLNWHKFPYVKACPRWDWSRIKDYCLKKSTRASSYRVWHYRRRCKI